MGLLNTNQEVNTMTSILDESDTDYEPSERGASNRFDCISQAPSLDRYRYLWAQVFCFGILEAVRGLEAENEDAFYWLLTDQDHPGSFTWLCDLFDLDVVAARYKVCDLRARYLSGEVGPRLAFWEYKRNKMSFNTDHV